ncbi:Myoferlin [Oopsacas minuta]|uniref:Myoferlin n=1 Tax=Oopsacas minuta TaxID=111878 RepID=A0AAV7JLV3_9METZ|nr:Myoferlin [Oopsacas minuta]
MLRVEVQGASGLKNQDYTKKSDPYCIIKFQGQSDKTKTIERNLSPIWNQVLEFEIRAPLTGTENIDLEIKDENTFGRDTLMGKASILIRTAVKSGRQPVASQGLLDKSGKTTLGTVNLIVSYNPPHERGRAGTYVERIAEDQNSPLEENIGIGMGDDWEIVENENPDEKDAGLSGLDSNKSAIARADKFKRKQARIRLPNEPLDFQLQIHCIEARRLSGGGGNISPSCAINIGSQSKSTSSVDSSINPVWDETLIFYFRIKPSELFNTMLMIKVVNSKYVVMENLIGSFQMDIGVIYDEPNHGFIQKWLLLTNIKDTSAGPKGYLKISIQVVGPGDSPSPLPHYDPISSHTDDIEGNLLRPAGINLQPATFKIRIYKAEDVPQMDSAYLETVKKIFSKNATESKNLVDPYVTVSYAGHTVTTGVRWTTCNPEWNESLALGTRFPSMSERIQIRLYDKDTTSQDDIIGTTFLYLSNISLPEGDNGFLPTFGPAWVNFYGSTREYKHIGTDYEHLNEGVFEGVAYRGRILMDLNTELGKYPATTQAAKFTREKSLAKGFKRLKHRIYVAFFHATQIKPHTSEVSFEVSIGNYGYREDPNAIIAPSTTQPTKPVTENNSLFFLPWGKMKPCCVIPCYWENNVYRIESMNILNYIADELELETIQVRELMKKEDVDKKEVSQAILNMLEKLSTLLSEPLPLLPRDAHTMLDIHWWGLRDKERNAILNEITGLKDLIDKEEVVYICEGFVNRIRVVAVESQISIPDIIIWMIHGVDRVAVARIPIQDLFYSKNPIARGRLCGKIHTRFLREPIKVAKNDVHREYNAQLRIAAWVGREKNTFNWEECIPGGTVMTFAETYENQIFTAISWGPVPFGLIPAWSDSTGKMSLPKESFGIPIGWKWDDDWIVSSAEDIEYDPEYKLHRIMEETYEVRTKDEDDQDWNDTKTVWEDENGNQSSAPLNVKPPKGWDWDESKWTIDTNRAVDEEGWEYGSNPDSRESFNPIELADSIIRRRKIVRVRVRKADELGNDKKSTSSSSDDEQWEYATTLSGPFYRVKQITHLFRRRRWLRRMVATEKNASNIFSITQEEVTSHIEVVKSKKDKPTPKKHKKLRESPRIFMCFEKEYRWTLRAYIYQARTLLSGDKNGLSDPFGEVSISTSSQKTRTINKSLSPTWCQTLTFNELVIYGEPEFTQSTPPIVVVDIYDKDILLRNEPLGQALIRPEVILNVEGPVTKMKWHNIIYAGRDEGQLLASFELILLDPEGNNLKKIEALELSSDQTYCKIPDTIRPKTQLMRIEVLLWGLRDMKRFELTSVNHPFVRISCGDFYIDSEHIKNAKINPNFPNPSIHLDCELPIEAVYMPPLQIQVLDKRLFGRTPIVGIHSVTTLKTFIVHTPGSTQALNVCPNLKANIPEFVGKLEEAGEPSSPGTKIASALTHLTNRIELESIESSDLEMEYSDFDWWSRYYASIGDERRSSGFESKGYEKMTYYKGELEKWFGSFRDRTKDFQLTRGKTFSRKSEVSGLFKGDIKVYPLSEDDTQDVPLIFKDIPEHGVNEVTVRVYIIRGRQFTPQDPFGKSDPYIKIVLGEKEMINDKENYIPNNLNPLFGKIFEFNTFIPQEHEMRVVVMDHDALSADDLIGYTSVDLENRYLSSMQATCGIPKYYFIAGPCKWRHQLLPTVLLDKYLKSNRYGSVRWVGNTEVNLCNQKFRLKEDFEPHGIFPHISNEIERKILTRQLGGQKQRLALYVLNLFEHVPDHIEERKLINPIQGEVPQGYLEMFVDIFPKADGVLPEPVDIAIRQPEDMVLRMVVWNAKDVELLDNPIYQDDPTADIYIKAFLRGQNKSKSTDVHYRSMNGEGMFNWRLVFPFKYLPIEQEIVSTEKEHFWKMDGTEKRVEPELVVQIWDNDQFLPDDYIGSVEFKLINFYKPRRSAFWTNLEQITPREDHSNADNIFKRKRLRGWWPVVKIEDGNNPNITGKIDMEIEILTAAEAIDKPAGEGRDEPNANPFLAKPIRPATSFAWFTSPFKSFRYIIWKHYRTQIIIAAILLAPVVLFLLILL